jgi:hypothetical protein
MPSQVCVVGSFMIPASATTSPTHPTAKYRSKDRVSAHLTMRSSARTTSGGKNGPRVVPQMVRSKSDMIAGIRSVAAEITVRALHIRSANTGPVRLKCRLPVGGPHL